MHAENYKTSVMFTVTCILHLYFSREADEYTVIKNKSMINERIKSNEHKSKHYTPSMMLKGA